MNKLGIILVAVIVLLLGGGAYLFSKPTKVPEISGYEYFWGDGCPHCKIVAEFFDGWADKDKIKITKYEVWNNQKNAVLMAERAKNCNIQRTEMGVPLLVKPDGTCLTGDQPIITHFKSLTF